MHYVSSLLKKQKAKAIQDLSRFVFLGLFLSVFFTACVSLDPPVEEYTIARTAIDAAKAVDAPRFSPGFFSKAELAYRNGQALFEDRDYSSARDEFIKARLAAEKAEYSARLIRHKNGDVL
jgi:hypothetical protein